MLSDVLHLPSCYHWKETGCDEPDKDLSDAGIDMERMDSGHIFTRNPGGFCLRCGKPDYEELCYRTNCLCGCHDDAWEGLYA